VDTSYTDAKNAMLGNNLLATLGKADSAALEPCLRVIRVKRGNILHERGADICCTYFPCGGSIVAFDVLVGDGRLVQTTLIGREGAVGGVVSRGHLPAYARARVIFAGELQRIKIAELERAKARSPVLAQLFVRYSDCLLAQIMQSAACNATHPIEQRLAKWLRFALDRTGNDEVALTQEQLSNMLGVSRPHISLVIKRLKALEILDTRRGTLCVRDPNRLQQICCGCHDAVRKHFETVLKGVYPII
jgi:hypothetical protein